MAGPKIFDRVLEVVTTSGTGTLSLPDLAPTGYRAWSSVLSDTDTTIYTIVHATLSEWEIGIGTFSTTGPTLARTTILASSNAGSVVDLTAGNKNVFCGMVRDYADHWLHPRGAYSSQSAFQAGRLVFPSDAYTLLRDSGSVFQPYGPIWPITPPVDGDFSWVNQSTATITASKGGLFLTDVSAGGGNAFRMRVKSAPATPWSVTAMLMPLLAGATFGGFGLAFRQSSDGKLAVLRAYNSGADLTIASSKFTSPILSSADYSAVVTGGYVLALGGGPVFFKIADNGTSRICSYSTDGYNFRVFHTVGRTDFMTADQVGWFIDPRGQETACTLVSWAEGA